MIKEYLSGFLGGGYSLRAVHGPRPGHGQNIYLGRPGPPFSQGGGPKGGGRGGGGGGGRIRGGGGGDFSPPVNQGFTSVTQVC